MRRLELLGAGIALAAIIGAALTAFGASTTAVAVTSAPAVSAWWNVQNQGGVIAPPAPVGVSPADLFVEGAGGAQQAPSAPPPPFPSGVGSEGGADAIAGIALPIPSGAKVDQLILHFDGTAPVSPSVEACRATAPFGAQENGPWSDVPPYDCTTTSVGKLAPDGKSLLFADIGGLVKDGTLRVVMVPQFYDREVWQKPGADAITFTPPPPAFDLSALPQPAFPGTADTGAGAALAPLPPIGAAGPVGSISTPASPSVPAVPRATVSGPRVDAAGGVGDRVVAGVALLAALCLFALMTGANSTLMRRLFGARAAQALPGRGRDVRGVGRFARPRVGRPDSI